MTRSVFIERLLRLPAAALSALKNPAADPMTALLVLGAVMMALLVLILLVVLVLPMDSDDDEDAESDSEAEGEEGGEDEGEAESAVGPGRSVSRRRIWLMVGALALAALALGWRYSVSDAACVRCHFTRGAVQSHAAGTHKAVPCRRCHVASGVAGAMAARVNAAENVVAQVTGKSQSAVGAGIRNSSCLACHERITDGTVVARAVRMRHADVLAVGFACIDCHNTVGHGSEVTRARYPQMAQCIACHDGDKAKSECATCHTSDVGAASRQVGAGYRKVHLVVDSCRGCHSMKPCIACHGLELPHSALFKSGFHARKALLQPRICVKCHSTQLFCNGCHHFGVDAKGLPMLTAHQGDIHLSRTIRARGACVCHDIDTERFCNYCHGPQPER